MTLCTSTNLLKVPEILSIIPASRIASIFLPTRLYLFYLNRSDNVDYKYLLNSSIDILFPIFGLLFGPKLFS